MRTYSMEVIPDKFRENLAKMAEYLKSVPEDKFNMGCYNLESIKKDTTVCDTVGCVIGHCINLDASGKAKFLGDYGESGYSLWSTSYTGFVRTDSAWNWLFSSDWDGIDNTITGAIARINWLLEYGLPSDWHEQMTGKTKLCYTK